MQLLLQRRLRPIVQATDRFHKTSSVPTALEQGFSIELSSKVVKFVVTDRAHTLR